MARADLPGGLVTFLFTDVVGSTTLVQMLGEDYPPLLFEHRRLLRRVLTAADGIELSVEGDGCLFVFSDTAAALDGCVRAQRELVGPGWPNGMTRPAVRMGLSTGVAQPVNGEYISAQVHRAARIATAAHGGQILCCATTAEHVATTTEHPTLVDLGPHRLRGFDQQQRLYQLCAPGLAQIFPQPRVDKPADSASAPTAGPGQALRDRADGGHHPLSALTRAESAVALLVAEGLSNRQIAAKLFISRFTVETHIKHIFAKLQVSSRAALATTMTRLTATTPTESVRGHPDEKVCELPTAGLRGQVDADGPPSPGAQDRDRVDEWRRRGRTTQPSSDGDRNGSGLWAVPRQLPAVAAHFVGRQAQLQALCNHGDRPPGAGPAVTLAVAGMAGVGKTALAIQAAHRLARRFPDGQMFVDLHGFTAGVAPVQPEQTLDRLLRDVGVPGERIPSGLDERAALWRTVLAERRMLIVLDNAAAEEQVQPLLPGTAGCLVLVTSRRHLTGLDTTHALSLDTMPQRDAITLFLHSADRPELTAETPDVLGVVEMCARLPLAIRIAATRLKHRRVWTVADLVARLQEVAGLAAFHDGQSSVHATIHLSYQHLSADAQLLYRMLGLHPGPDVDVYAVAALTASTFEDARRLLDRLVDDHMLQESRPGRYEFHDLVRAHAADMVMQQPPAERHAALTRMLDYYQHTTASATAVAYPNTFRRRPAVPPAGTSIPALDDWNHAQAWLDGELANLLAATLHAAQHGWPEHTWHLSATLDEHLLTRGHHRDLQTLHQHALNLARRQGNHRAEIDALNSLGLAERLLGLLERSGCHFGEAAQIARDTGDRAGELYALEGLRSFHRISGRHEQAAHQLGQALQIARDIGGCAGELHTPNDFGQVKALLDLARMWMIDYEFGPAAQAARSAVEVASRLNLAEAQASARITIATARFMSGDASDLTELIAITEDCRRSQLNSWRRAVGNLAWAYLEQGDVAEAARLIYEIRATVRYGAHALPDSDNEQAQNAYMSGDWPRVIAATTAVMRRLPQEWDPHAIAISAWMRVLRGESIDDDPIEAALTAARRSGFHRVLRSVYAHSALCRALQGQTDAARALLDELDRDWRQTEMMGFAEWVAAAGHAAALLGTEAADQVERMLLRSKRVTPWVEAALEMASGALAEDGSKAAGHYLTAAERYAAIGTPSDEALALAAALRTLPSGDDRLDAVLQRVREFAEHNDAPLLVGLGGVSKSVSACR